MKIRNSLLLVILLLTGCSSVKNDSSSRTNSQNSDETPLLYSENFSDEDNSWYKGEDDQGKFFYSDGLYYIQETASDNIQWSDYAKTFTDGVYNVEVRQVTGDDSETGEVIFWRIVDQNNHYSLLITDNGEFLIQKFFQGKPSTIIDWTSSQFLNTDGKTNKVTIAFAGDESEIYFNGNYVTSFSDSSFLSGEIGLGVFADKTSRVEGEFDNITVYKYDPKNGYTPIKPNSTSTPSYSSITWKELAHFLDTDHTNWKTYNPDNYVCLDFAIDLVENAKKQNINARIIGVDFTNGETGHAFVAFETSDKGTVYVEPQEDVTYLNVAVGNNLCDSQGKFECMGKIKSIEYLDNCNHQHVCSSSPQ